MSGSYEKNFLDYSSKLDAITDSCCEVSSLAYLFVENKDEKIIKKLCKKLSEINELYSENHNVKAVAKELYESLVKYIGHQKILSICNDKDDSVIEDARSLDELLLALNSLVGLKDVKQQVRNLIAYQKLQKLRQENNLKTSRNTLHLAFTGNPGSGKTTVARIIGHIYKKIGLLSKGHFIEVSRTDLIAGYQGQTALKVKSVVEKAKGGVLFIDEAYSITENENSDSYGRECLTELTKALEDYRDDLVVIVAGYTKPMEKFFESNSGLKSRFNSFIEFIDYDATELEEILDNMCNQNDYEIDEKLREKIRTYFETELSDKKENFSNGRFVRNFFDDLIMNQSLRLEKVESPTIIDLKKLTEADFPSKSNNQLIE